MNCPVPGKGNCWQYFLSFDRYGILHDNDEIFSYLHRFEDKVQEPQLSFF